MLRFALVICGAMSVVLIGGSAFGASRSKERGFDRAKCQHAAQNWRNRVGPGHGFSRFKAGGDLHTSGYGPRMAHKSKFLQACFNKFGDL